MSPPSASAPSTAPSASTRPVARGSRDSGTWRHATHTTYAARGTLIRKTQRQDPISTSQPPRNGPAAVATPPRPDHAPIARARSVETNDAWIIARLPGVSSAPPTPWRAREATSTSALGASPQAREATANQTTPITKTRRRPKRSPSTPPTRMNEARVSA